MLLRLTMAALLAAGLAGCAAGPVSSSAPFPVYGNPVNPTPAPGYVVQCRSTRGADFLFFPGFYSGCEQLIAPAPVVLQARG